MSGVTDLREQQADLTSALSDLSREELVEVVAFVLGAYVRDQAPPVAPPSTSEQEVAALAKLPFASVIRELQLRAPHAEWSAFRVEQGQVMVRAGGQWVALSVAAATEPALPRPPSPPAVVSDAPASVPAPPVTVPPVASPVASVTPATSPAPPSEPKSDESAERFRLLELD